MGGVYRRVVQAFQTPWYSNQIQSKSLVKTMLDDEYKAKKKWKKRNLKNTFLICFWKKHGKCMKTKKYQTQTNWTGRKYLASEPN